jgi:hypothetical protein
MTRQQLTEADKIQILIFKSHQMRPYEIAQQLGKPDSTVRTFLTTYERRHTLSGKRGRRRRIFPDETANDMLNQVAMDPHLSLRDQIAQMGLQIAVSCLQKFRHQHHIHCYQQKPFCPLTPEQMAARVQFCNHILNDVDPAIPIIFTDESSVEIDLRLGPVWRPKGARIPEEFYESPAHPMRVMIWGGIGPDGYRTSLVQCPPSVNGVSYIEFLAGERIIFNLNTKFGSRQYLFQQDNAPAHCVHSDVLSNFVNLLDWPPHSPDLSPIEQIWAYLKKKLKGKNFQTADQLFAALSQEWQRIPDAKISKYYTAFRARCTVCAAHGGESLNGHWKEVHALHHQPEMTHGP